MYHRNCTQSKPKSRTTKQEKQRRDGELARQAYADEQTRVEKRTEELRALRELRASQMFLDQNSESLLTDD